MQIDASAAIKRLGIKSQVRFVETDLREVLERDMEADPTLRAPEGYSFHCPAAANGDDPGLIYLDPYVIYEGIRRGEETVDSVKETIAHELVHVAQFEQLGLARGYAPMDAMLEIAYEQSKGYDQNRFEVEARELAPWLAPLVEVTL